MALLADTMVLSADTMALHSFEVWQIHLLFKRRGTLRKAQSSAEVFQRCLKYLTELGKLGITDD
jgi:hypothetical protein